MHAQVEELCVNMNASFSYPCLIVSVKADVIIEISPKFAVTIDCLPLPITLVSGLVTGSLGKNIVTATLQCTVEILTKVCEDQGEVPDEDPLLIHRKCFQRGEGLSM